MEDFIENIQDLGIFLVDVVWRLAVVGPEVHVSIWVEIVHKFNFVFVHRQEFCNRPGLWLRKWGGASVILSTRVFATSLRLVPTYSIITIKVNADSFRVISTLSSKLSVHILPLKWNLPSLCKILLNVCKAIYVDDWDYVIFVLDEHVYVVLLLVDDTTM